MRKIVIGGLVLGALAMVACDDKPSGGNAMPSASASAAPPPSAAAAAPSASAKPEPEKAKKAEGPKDHKALLKAMAEAWGTHDAKKVAGLYAEDGTITRPGRPELKGREAIEKRLGENFAAFKDLTIVPGRTWEKDKHTVVFEWVDKGTNTGDWPEIGIPKATNKPFAVVGASWVEVNDEGFIKTERNYLDGPTLFGQIMEDKKNPVRAAINTPPDGMTDYESPAMKAKEAKDEKEKAELTKVMAEEKKNLEVEDKVIGHMNAGKPDEALKLVADDVKYADYTMEKDVSGKKTFGEFVHKWFTAFPDIKTKSTASFVDGDFVIEEFEYTGTQKGALGSIKPTNKTATFHQLEVDQFKDGKLVKAWVYGNNGELLTQLGVAAPGIAPSTAPSAKPAAK